MVGMHPVYTEKIRRFSYNSTRSVSLSTSRSFIKSPIACSVASLYLVLSSKRDLINIFEVYVIVLSLSYKFRVNPCPTGVGEYLSLNVNCLSSLETYEFSLRGEGLVGVRETWYDLR
ncbi:hypothetical protein [Sulfuracidifex tepidarius]|uniref:Uncharacterized protein n=1 Tax=Sulfuracidifex tepidarius TaxID=1294262 RepID=A0A510E0G2_9CREN|nr:hypothetical protein [Sulfuracidifex tepidarius]BBG25976.1 hypothetical protein IC007_0481 [Sulfuracidifex tepidarius]